MYNVIVTDIRGSSNRYQCERRPYIGTEVMVISRPDTDITYVMNNIISVKVVYLENKTLDELRSNHQISIDDIMKGE